MNLSVIVPVYNEEKTVLEVLQKLTQLKCVTEVIVVDDDSTDHSFKIAYQFAKKNKKIHLFKLSKNSGKTAAVNEGIKHSTSEIIMIQDSDLEYDPFEIPGVIEPIINGKADVVYGSRFLVKKTTRVLYFYHYIANKLLTYLSNLFTNLNMTDIETCYKAFKSPILKNLELRSKGFGMEIEITAMIARLPVRIYEVPISYYGRTYEEGKKIKLIDGIYALYYIIYYNLVGFRLRRAYFKKTKIDLSL